MTEKKNILIAGARGFLGGNLSAYLGDRWNCFQLSRRPRTGNSFEISWDEAELRELLGSRKFCAIVNCAVCYNRKDSLQQTVELMESNLLTPTRLLSYAVEYNVPLVVMFDTYFRKYPADCQFMRQYRLSKEQQYEWGRLYESSVTVVTLALEHLYGPQDSNLRFVPWLIRSLLEGKDKLDLSLGEQRRDFIYVEDVCRLIDHIVARHPRQVGSYTYEVGTGLSISIREFAETCKELTGSSTLLDFGAISYRDGELMDSFADVAPLSELGWTASVSLEEGLNKLIEEMKR